MDPRRTVAVSLWLGGVIVLVLGLAIGALAMAFAGSRAAVGEPTAVGSSASTRAPTASRASSADRTAESSGTPTAVSARPLTSASFSEAPRGSLAVVRAGDSYGQGSPSGPCANWLLRFQNNSNTEIVQIVLAPSSGVYTNFHGWNGTAFPTVPAAVPRPAVLNVSIPPYGYQDLRFQNCTSTPPPTDPNYQFDVSSPQATFTWVTGQTGTVS